MGTAAGVVLSGAILLAAGVTGQSIAVAVCLGLAGFAIGWLATTATWTDASGDHKDTNAAP